MSKLHIKKGDIVFVNAGEDKGKTGRVLEVLVKDNRAIVEGINMVCFDTILIPSTTARFSFTNTFRTRPVLPLSSPVLTKTISPFLICNLLITLNFSTIKVPPVQVKQFSCLLHEALWLPDQRYGYHEYLQRHLTIHRHCHQSGYKNRQHDEFPS